MTHCANNRAEPEKTETESVLKLHLGQENEGAMNRKLIFGVLALSLFVPAGGGALAGTISDVFIFGRRGGLPPLNIVIPEDVPGVPQTFVIPNVALPLNLAVQFYQDANFQVLSDQVYTYPNQVNSRQVDLHFESDPDLFNLGPLGFPIAAKLQETGGLQDVSQYFSPFIVEVQSDLNVPEPASITLLGMGIAGIAGYAWRRRKQASA